MSGTLLLALRILSAVALYIFLLWAFYILWLDIRTQSQKLSGQKIPSLKLTLQSSDLIPKSIRVKNSEVFIGRDPSCDCVIEDEAVSSQHARISFHHNQWWLEDLESANGTKLNNELVITPTVLIGADKIQCGHTIILVEWESSN